MDPDIVTDILYSLFALFIAINGLAFIIGGPKMAGKWNGVVFGWLKKFFFWLLKVVRQIFGSIFIEIGKLIRP